MKIILMAFVLTVAGFSAAAQTLSQAEYFLDTDQGFGKNTLVNLAGAQTDGNYNLSISLPGATVGRHLLYIRTKDNTGRWSMTTRRTVEVVSAAKKILTGGEYFFDDDPGFSLGRAIAVSPQDSVTLQDFTAATAALSPGFHKLYIRLKDNSGKWSLTARHNVEVTRGPVSLVNGVEYFFNTDPGVGKAARASFNTPLADGSFSFKIPVSAIPSGAHTLYVRAKDSVNNNWSLTQWQRDSVVTSVNSGLWSQPATWSNNKVPDGNTIVLLYHAVEVDIVDAVCRSLTPYGANAKCTVDAGKALKITGKP